MSELLVRCRCGKGYRLRVEHAGRSSGCTQPGCGQVLLVPPAWVFEHFAGRSLSLDELGRVVTARLTVRCGNGHPLRVPIERAGKVGRCPECRERILIPAAEVFLAHSGASFSLEQLQALAGPAPGEQPSAAPAGPLWRAGVVVDGKYEVKRLLGQGSFGAVWQVRHREWGEDLAVKELLRTRAASERSRQSFRKECLTWLELGMHPHVVAARSVRELGGSLYLFLEYCEGGSLAEWIEQGRTRELATALDIGIQLCWGLAHCHARGVIHRDFKPLNVMMSGEGEARVTDFGAVKLAALQAEGTEGGGVLEDLRRTLGGLQGTPPYMPPEQWSRQADMDQRIDLYALGVTLFELLTGTWPIQAAQRSVPAWMEAHARGMPTPLRQLRPDAPEALEGLIGRCLAKGRQDRPGSALEVASALTAIYREVTGQDYPGVEPSEADLLAPGLNNRGCSLYDMGLKEEAERAWREAVGHDPAHLETTYNLGLVRWRRAEMTDDALVESLRAIRSAQGDSWLPRYLLAEVHLERGDCAGAVEELEGIPSPGADGEAAQSLLTRARELLPHSRRCLHTLRGHQGAVTSVCLSPDGRHALTGSGDHAVRLWEVVSGRCLHTLQGHTDGVTSVCLSDDGRRALTGSHDASVRLWEVASGRCLHTLYGHTRGVTSVCLSPDGCHALTGSDDRTAYLWEVASGRSLHILKGHKDGVTEVCFSPDGRCALTAGDRTARLWEVASGRCLHSLRGHTGPVSSVCFSPDGRHALTGSHDGTARLWEVASGRCLHTLQGHTRGVASVCLSPDGRHALTGSHDDTARLWEVAPGCCLYTLRGHTSWVTSACFSPDGRHVLTGSQDRTARLWEMVSGRCLRTFQGHEDSVRSVSISPDGRHALTGSEDRTARLWEVGGAQSHHASSILSRLRKTREMLAARAAHDRALQEALEAQAGGRRVTAATKVRAARGQQGYARSNEAVSLWAALYVHLPRAALRAAWKTHTLQGHEAGVTSVSISPDGRHALTGSKDRTARLWELASGGCLHTLQGHEAGVTSVSISPDGRHALTGSHDWTARLWEVASGHPLRTLEGHKNGVESVSLSSDGRHALTGGADRTARLWEVASGRCLHVLKGHRGRVMAVSLSPDGRHALTGSDDNTARLWEVATGRCLHTLQGHPIGVTSVSFSPDGHQALTGGDLTARLWEVASGRCLHTLHGDTSLVTSVSISPDGRHVLGGSVDGTARLWEVASGQTLHSFQGHTASVESVCLSPDGRHALTGSDDRTARLWFLDWDLEERQPDSWDEGARPYLTAFLSCHTPFAGSLPSDREPTDEEITHALTRRGKPSWSEEDFQRLLFTLGCAGFGWLKPEGVRHQLEEMAAGWQGPPS